MAINAKTGQYVPDEQPGDFPTYAPSSGGGYDTSKVIPSARDQELQRMTDAGWVGSSYADGTPVGDLAIYQQKNKQAVVDSNAAKTNLQKIQGDFQSILNSLTNKQSYNQGQLNPSVSLVDLMKSKGIADTSPQARQQLAQSAGIVDYNPNNAESNKKLADAILNSSAVSSTLNKYQPGSNEYNQALSTVSGAVASSTNQPSVQTVKQTSGIPNPDNDPFIEQYNQVTQQIDKNAESITSSINQLKTGAIPLTADQQAVVDSTQRSFDNAIKQQKEANQNQENLVRRSAFRGGAEYTPDVSSSIIKNVIDSNILKISEYDQQAIGAIAKLKQDFKDANYKNIKEGYDILNKTLKDKQDNLLAFMKLSHDYEKESLNYNLDVLKYQETVRKNKADEEIAGLKLQDTIGPGGYDEKTTKYITSLNQSVSNNAAYKKAISSREFIGNIITSLDRKSGLGDIAAINQFQKIIDEGAVTRDKDVDLVNSTESLLGRLVLKIDKLKEGDQLSEAQRNEMRVLANQIQERVESNLKTNPYINSKVKELNLYGVNIDDTILSEIINSGGNTNAPVEVTTEAIQSLMNQDYSNSEIQEWIKAQKSFNQAGNASASNLRQAIVAQESSGNYKAVNKDSGALGKYQIMPSNLPGLIGMTDTPSNRQKFLNSPELQDKAFDNLLNELNNTYKGDVKKVLAAYYGGSGAAKIVGTKAADKPQGKYPSINDYVNQILNKLA